MWYSAHAIFYFKCEIQDSFLAHENIYLIQSNDEHGALVQATSIAQSNQELNEDGHLQLNGKPAQYIFAGIRRIIAVEQTTSTEQDKIVSGLEITYSALEVDTLEDISRLVNGDFVEVLYRE